MKLTSLKKHLKPYSIYDRRKTTINHAFASAMAPYDDFDGNIERIAKAIARLGQNPNDDLYCVYCGQNAETWDHLVNLVKDSQLQGYGHQIGNLVPACQQCNSKKGRKDWEKFVEEKFSNKRKRNEVKRRIKRYLASYAKEVDIKNAKQCCPEEWREFKDIKNKIFNLMKEADNVAAKLRLKITKD